MSQVDKEAKLAPKIYEYKNVKVKPETYEMLIKARAVYELESGKRLSMDDIIRVLLDALPSAQVTIGLVKERRKGGRGSR